MTVVSVGEFCRVYLFADVRVSAFGMDDSTHHDIND
jgi:hypothetical protein